MKKSVVMMLATAAVLALVGCKEQEVVQTVEWFEEHPAELKAQLAKCESNPGELATTPNCINASQADSSLIWSKRGGIKVAPLTAEDFNKKHEPTNLLKKESGENTPVQTVDWYKTHEAERTDMIAKCKANPGELDTSPNCINAVTAENHLTLKKRGYTKHEPINVLER